MATSSTNLKGAIANQIYLLEQLSGFTRDKGMLLKTTATEDKEGSKVIRDIERAKDIKPVGFAMEKDTVSIKLVPELRNSKKFYQKLD